MNTKNIIVALIIFILVGITATLLINNSAPEVIENGLPTATTKEMNPEPQATTSTMEQTERGDSSVIGTSIQDEAITAYHFGTGATEILIIGGIHGGYSWNTALLAYEMIDYLEANPAEIPENVTVTIIPAANPDGLTEAVGTAGMFRASAATSLSEAVRVASRFNQNDVDLNRNFDCDWQPFSMWQSREVSGGASVFSEPEAVAIRDYVLRVKPAAAVVWFSSEGKVYPSACTGTPSAESTSLANAFGAASGYGVSSEFDAYTINGDMVNWLAKESIPAISVLLTNHTETELAKNQAGLKAVIEAYQN
jgi:predicted deacylase